MGILDEAIREHLDLKRKHGAREAELREIEDEAFGSAEQPDPFAAGGELFGEVSAAGLSDAGNEEPTRLVEPEALRREGAPSPESAPPEPDLGAFEEPAEPSEGLAQIPGQTELPGEEIPGQESLDEALEEPAPPGRDAAPEPPPAGESLEELIAEEEPFPEDGAAPPPDLPVEPGPSADRGGALEVTELEPDEEPEASVPEPPPPPPAGPEPPGRARGRIDVPTQEHPPPGQTGDLPPFPSESPDALAEEPASDALPLDQPEPAEQPPLEGEAPELYDFETDEDPLASGDRQDDDFEALGPAEEEAPYVEDEQPYPEGPASDAAGSVDDPGTAVRPALDDETGETADFAPEKRYEEDEGDEDLWFEKGPPKDFDFDD